MENAETYRCQHKNLYAEILAFFVAEKSQRCQTEFQYSFLVWPAGVGRWSSPCTQH